MENTHNAPSLMWRACLALLLMVAFYVFAMVVAGLLFAVPVLLFRAAERVNIHLLIACWVAAGLIIYSIFPRRERFVAPGPLLSEEQHPALFTAIRQVAQATGQAMPSEVYLLLEMNAFVSQRGGWMGFFSRRIMGVGLPLLEVMSVAELKAVLAHEFGHYRRGDTALGPWVYVTRASIERTIQNMNAGLVRSLFVAVWKLYVRITHAVSRQEEFAADGVAVHACGSQVFAGMMRKLESSGLSFSYYLQNEWLPVIGANVVPPLVDGYRRMLAAPDVRASLEKAEEQRAQAQEKPDPYDTHPTAAQRLAAIPKDLPGDAACVIGGEDQARAITLLSDLGAAEHALCEAVLVSPKNGAARKAIAWEEVLDAVYLPLWREKLKRYRECLQKIPIPEIAALVRDRARLEEAFAGVCPVVTETEWRNEIKGVLGAALSLVLRGRAFQGTALPGEDITFVCNGRSVYPFRLTDTDNPKSPEPAEWADICRGAGVESLTLGWDRDACLNEALCESKGMP